MPTQSAPTISDPPVKIRQTRPLRAPFGAGAPVGTESRVVLAADAEAQAIMGGCMIPSEPAPDNTPVSDWALDPIDPAPNAE